MKIEEAVQIIKSFDIPEINEAMRWITPMIYERDKYKENFIKMVKIYKKMLPTIHKDKEIELNKTYWVTEWSWSPMCDGRFVYEETIRSHKVINGIDCYFTDSNYRTYFKEDIYESREEAEEVVRWQNKFAYDYETIISRQNDIR